jgi:hypothetical protein
MEKIKPQTFCLERKTKNDGLTFSEEGVYLFLIAVFEYLNKVMACAMKQGFDKKKPVDIFEIIVQFKVNGQEFDPEEVLKTYPKMMGFSIEALAKMILEKAYGNGGR